MSAEHRIISPPNKAIIFWCIFMTIILVFLYNFVDIALQQNQTGFLLTAIILSVFLGILIHKKRNYDTKNSTSQNLSKERINK